MHPENRDQRNRPGRTREEDFAAFFRCHVEGVTRLLCRIVSFRSEAEDLVQEAFLRSYVRGPEGPDREYQKAWLYRTAVNLGYNALRNDKRRGAREAGAVRLETVGPHEEPTPAEVFMRNEKARIVRGILRDLPDRSSRILSLRYGGLSYREIAEVMEIAPTSVGTLLARAEAAFEDAYKRLTPATQLPGDRGGV